MTTESQEPDIPSNSSLAETKDALVVETPSTQQPTSVVENESVDETTVELQWLDPRFVTYQRVTSAIVFGILSIAASIGTVVACFSVDTWLVRGLILLGLVCFLCMLGFFGFFWPKIAYRNVRWCFTEVGFEYWRGVWWKHRLAVPASRVQHVDVAQGPVERMFGLGKLTIYTAGTKHSAIEVEGFAHEQALELRDQLIAQKEAIDVL